MCGRFALTYSWADIHAFSSLLIAVPEGPDMPPRYNIAPTQPIAIIADAGDGEGKGLLVRWGFVPSWVKDPKAFTLLLNARSETAAQKPSFRNAIRRRRILVPATGFFEWQRFGKDRKSQPYWVAPTRDGPVFFGGLMETWIGADGSEIDTACILTTAANDNFSHIHHRMPVTIEVQHHLRWLDHRDEQLGFLDDLLVPPAPEFYRATPIGEAVNKVANADPSILEPVEPEADGGEEDGASANDPKQLDLL